MPLLPPLPVAGPVIGIGTAVLAPLLYGPAVDYFYETASEEFFRRLFYNEIILPTSALTGLLAGTVLHPLLRPLLMGGPLLPEKIYAQIANQTTPSANYDWRYRSGLFLAMTLFSCLYVYKSAPEASTRGARELCHQTRTRLHVSVGSGHISGQRARQWVMNVDQSHEDILPNLYGNCGVDDIQPNLYGNSGVNDIHPNLYGNCGVNDIQPNLYGNCGVNDIQPNLYGNCGVDDILQNLYGNCGVDDIQPNLYGNCGHNDIQPNLHGNCESNKYSAKFVRIIRAKFCSGYILRILRVQKMRRRVLTGDEKHRVFPSPGAAWYAARTDGVLKLEPPWTAEEVRQLSISQARNLYRDCVCACVLASRRQAHEQGQGLIEKQEKLSPLQQLASQLAERAWRAIKNEREAVEIDEERRKVRQHTWLGSYTTSSELTLDVMAKQILDHCLELRALLALRAGYSTPSLDFAGRRTALEDELMTSLEGCGLLEYTETALANRLSQHGFQPHRKDLEEYLEQRRKRQMTNAAYVVVGLGGGAFALALLLDFLQ
eukprot:g49833.t1